MTHPALRLLLVEDAEDDALLIERELRKGGLDPFMERVESLDALERALASGPWDAVLADFKLPGFTGLDALRLVQAKDLDLPFLLVSGVLGEETAVEAMKAGVHDYIRKGQYSRLVPALERELREAAVRGERRRAEVELAKHREHLEELVRERTAQLEQANGDLEAFSYSVAHDLRAPLRGIAVLSQVLLEQHASQMPHEAGDNLRRIHGRVQQMSELINDLLAFSHLGRQQVQKRLVQPGEIVSASLEELLLDHQGRKVEVLQADLPPCEADPGLLKQVFLNLLSNALKFTAACEAPHLQIGCLAEAGASVYFVKDNGIGFDMREAGKLFGAFQRLPSARGYRGTGLGLAIVARIVASHGGRVWAEATPGAGATFYFTLGRPPAPHPPSDT